MYVHYELQWSHACALLFCLPIMDSVGVHDMLYLQVFSYHMSLITSKN